MRRQSQTANDTTVALGRLAVLVTILAWLAFTVVTVAKYVGGNPTNSAGRLWEGIVYVVVLTLLTASALAYLITRLGFFYRTRAHRRVPRAAIDEFFSATSPRLTVLVPSYREQANVIRTTLLSAALQEHPNMRVVLLIDDPPQPTYAREERLLSAARALPGEVQTLLAAPRTRFERALERFERAVEPAEVDASEIDLIASHYVHAADWLEELARGCQLDDHAERFFAEQVIGRLADDLALVARALRTAANERAPLPYERLRQLYRRLADTFRAELTSFERKRYASLSHDANKAMNLNSYIGLMGSSYHEIDEPSGPVLVSDENGELDIPDCDFVLTLDADSVLLPEYCARLVYLLEQSQHNRVAVAQTPYSAFPGAKSRLERIAGATTDLQHIVHQGMTHYDATFWVGANAVLRKRALDAVCETEYMGDWPIRRYVQDRTVIEDTESSIDLGVHGWRLLNYPERLSYSATPPDFGALCIQRRRWANGGLLILPKLWRQSRARRRRGEPNPFGELFLRVNYMASIFWASACLLVLFAYQFSDRLLTPLVSLIALPYFLAIAADLRRCGYRGVDVLSIYGFNLILLPVNLAGAGSSIMQALTGAKGEFKRTPKVRDRTTAPLAFVLLPYAIVALALYTVLHDYEIHHWTNLVFAAVNAVLGGYAILAFIGLPNSLVDIWANVATWLYKPARPSQEADTHGSPLADGMPEWALVLHYGTPHPTERAGAPQVTPPGGGASTRAAITHPRPGRRIVNPGAQPAQAREEVAASMELD